MFINRRITPIKGIMLSAVMLLAAISGHTQSISYPGPQNYVVNVPIAAISPVSTGFTLGVNGYTQTFAGSGAAGYANGQGTSASFNQPLGAAVDASGNIYVADAGSHLIRKISPTGMVTTIAGTANTSGFSNVSPGTFWHPVGLAVDASGTVYVADEDNNAIRKITSSGVISTMATGFNLPCGVAVDASGNAYVADYNNNQIKKVTPGGTVSIFAGNASGTSGSTDGTGTGAYFNHPFGITIDGSGNLYVADRLNNMIRKITPAAVVTTVAGATTAGFVDASGLSARFNVPTSIAVDASGYLYVADESNQRIRMISPSGAVSTLSGTGTQGSAVNGLGNVAVYNNPFAIAVGATGFVFVGDDVNNLVRSVACSNYSIYPALPAGLSFTPSTGLISGTPTATSAATAYTINGYYSSGYATTTLSIAVNPATSVNPSSSQNYIATYSPRHSGVTTSVAIYPLDNDRTQVQTTIQYVDGLGRPLQTVQARGSFGGNDIVQPVAYDPMGREANHYMPYANNTTVVSDGRYKSDAMTQQGNFYNTSTAWATGTVRTAYPVAGVTYEPSPENRVTEQGFAGQSWQLSGLNITGGGHTKKITYGTNTSTETIILWIVNSNYNGATGTTNYAAGTLFKTTTTDENQNSTITYTDKTGHVVCKKVQSGASSYLTIYYIYDDLGNLSYVIPPLPSTSVNGNPVVAMPTSFVETDNVFLNYMYGYHYDGRSRVTAKKIPGKGWEYIVFNTLDQPVLSQDPNQNSKGIWMVTHYDAIGRPVMTGEYASSSSQATLQTAANANTNNWESFSNATTNYGYTHVTYPDISSGTGNKVLTANYYDVYDVITNTSVNPGSTVFTAPSTSVDTLNQCPRGLPVATLVNVLGTTNYLFTVNHYDKLGRAVRTISQHYEGGSPAYNKYDLQDNQYSFQSLATRSIRSHYLPSSSNPQVTITTWTSYEAMNRPILAKQQYVTQTVTGGVITLSKVDYNELGQMTTHHLHSTNTAANPASNTFLQHVNYLYNERGWTTKINDPTTTTDATYGTIDVFSEQLDYDQSTNGYSGVTAMYNGNISSLRWQTKEPSTVTLTQEIKGYVFAYDPLNRLTAANSQASSSGANLYNEALSYDDLGNIMTLTRNNNNSGTPLNSLKYNYTTTGGVRGNQLLSVTDNGTVSESQATTYTYNTNGSLITDTKKTITTPISYNELGLPSLVTINTGTVTLTYNYDATGRKLERIKKSGSTVVEDRVYDDGIEYSGTTASTLEFIQTPNGRAIPSGGGYNLQYVVTDHLGNTRAIFADVNGDGTLTADEIVQTTDYYAFGREIVYSQGVTPNPDNKYKYNQKEFQQDLSEYDYGARFYDPVIARWITTDPLTDLNRRWTPYNYVENNPAKLTDPDGMYSGDPNAPDNQFDQHVAWMDELHAKQDAEDQAYQTWKAQVAWLNWGIVYFGVVPGTKSSASSNSTASSPNGPELASADPLDVMAVLASKVQNGGQPGDKPDMRPAYPGAHHNAAGQLIYEDGVLQNFYNDQGGYDAVFTDLDGNQTRFPGVSVTNQFVGDGAGMTISSTIHLDWNNNGLADLEHEYGHYLDLMSRFKEDNLYFIVQVGIPSIFSAWLSKTNYQHSKSPCELVATRLAIKFFGPDSAIAKATQLYAR